MTEIELYKKLNVGSYNLFSMNQLNLIHTNKFFICNYCKSKQKADKVIFSFNKKNKDDFVAINPKTFDIDIARGVYWKDEDRNEIISLPHYNFWSKFNCIKRHTRNGDGLCCSTVRKIQNERK